MKIKHLVWVAMVALVATSCDNKKPEQVQEPVQQKAVQHV